MSKTFQIKRLDSGYYEIRYEGRHWTAQTEERRTEGESSEKSWCLLEHGVGSYGDVEYCNHFPTLKDCKIACVGMELERATA